MKKFTDLIKNFKSFDEFLAWLNEQEFSEWRKGCIGMDYCDMQLGTRTIQHRAYGMRLAMHKTVGFLHELVKDEAYYTWESIYGTERANEYAKKYNATLMEAPYTEIEEDYVLVFSTFEDCARFLWDTAEQMEKVIELFTANPETPLRELYEKSFA